MTTTKDVGSMLQNDRVESFAFQAEINQLMSLIINTFYSNKDIFLRELISNASDACDKARYISLRNSEKYGTRDHDIRISADGNFLVIEDNGVGMSKQDLLDNLGTIANSGTKNFMRAVAEGADISMIGQFGVGFYSAFLVANNVKVLSRSMEESLTYMWCSDAGGSFTIAEISEDDSAREDPYAPLANSGTRIVLDMKEDCVDYLTETTIRKIVKKHSEYVSYPVKLFTKRTEKVEIPEEEEEDSNEGEITEVKEEEPKEPKYEDREIEEWVLLNKTQPIWLRKPEDITHEEYDSFYKSLSNDWDSHLAVKHFSAEGSVEFKSLLYVPKRAPFDMFKSGKKKTNIKLYVKRVFIMDDCEELIPEWLSFVNGLVDSDDLPLNVSREMLQQNKIMSVIRRNIVKKCIEMFQDMAEQEDKSDYKVFYENFHQSIKLGIHEDEKNRDKLIKLLRFQTANSPASELMSLTEYVTRMKNDVIYYITGSSRKSLENSPFVKGVLQKGHDVLLMVDSIDEYMVQQVKEFEGKTLVNVSKDNQLFQTTDEDLEKGVVKLIKETLPDEIEKVVVSNRLGSAPCCLVSSEYGWSANMERIVKAQTLNTPSQMMFAGTSKKIMEINAGHPIIKRLQSSMTNTDMPESSRKDVIKLLYDTALLNSGYSQDDTSSFVDRVLKMMMAGMDIEEEPAREEDEPDVSDEASPQEDMEQVD